MYQNVTLAGFDDAKNEVAQQKSMLSNEIRECITNVLEEENESESIFKLVLQILNTEGWIRTDESGQTNLEFVDNAVTVLSEHFATLLIELLFTIPIDNAKLERMFSKLKQVKILHHSSLLQN